MCRGHFSNSHDNSPSSAAAVCRGHFSNSHDNSPSSAAAVCRGHFLIHMITAPHQRLPCVEDSALSLIHAVHEVHLDRKAREGDGTWCPCAESVRRRVTWHPYAGSARRWGVTWHPCVEKRAKVRSPLTHLRLKARSHLMPWRAHPISLPDSAGLLRKVVYAPTCGVQLGRIA